MFSYWTNPPSNRPSHHANDQGTSFKNPWPSAAAPTWAELLQVSFSLGWYQDPLSKHARARDVQVVVPDWGTACLKEHGLKKDDCIVGTWLGHASAIVELPLEGTVGKGGGKDSFWVLFDPIFSLRAGPTQYTGPVRMKNSPCQAADLPGCDAVVISHNHYDHLDLLSIKAIFKNFPMAKYFVPLGNKVWLCSTGIPEDQVHELDWWQNREYNFRDLGHKSSSSALEDGLIRFTCVPAQHNSGRSTLDQGKTLWSGWVIEQILTSKDLSKTPKMRRKGAIYHAGDTGYRRTARSTATCPIFKEIGEKFGFFDLSFLPIWRGGSLGFISSYGLKLSVNDIPSGLHASPADAIDIHKDTMSRNSCGIHFGTFIGSENESYEAVIEFDIAREEQGVMKLYEENPNENGRAGTVDIGGSLAVEIGP